jgi:putative ABC transport system ATP-binding protein
MAGTPSGSQADGMTPADVKTRAPAVALESVRKVYGRGNARVLALDDVSLAFEPATFTAIMGPSGSGKTTLLQCAAGLERPDGGTVRIAGTDLAGLGERRLARLRRRRVGFVFQSFNLLPSLTAAQNVVLPLKLAGEHPRRRVALDALARVGLGDRARHRPAELSGGQQQRAAIARALVTKPEVIFADEPTGALDRRTARDVLALLRDVADHDGRTLIMVTHDPVAAAFADRVVFLADGRIVDEVAAPDAEAIANRMTDLETW